MLIHPTYFPNVAHFVAMLTGEQIDFEVCDNYQKQTYRNRTEIYAANGKLGLTVPVNYTQKNRQPSKDVLISTIDDWQSKHLKSLDSAYRMSPFYEFYIDELMPIFETKFKFLLDLNLECFDLICNALDWQPNYRTTETFISLDTQQNDHRHLVHPKASKNLKFETYTQVFTQKHGYLDNLSILDLLFNEGPNAVNYLERQHLK